MKISALTYSYNIRTPKVSKNDTVNCNEQKTYNKIAQNNNAYYYPINFFGQKRTFQTSKPNLAEKSGNFALCKFSDLTCPACGKKMLNQTKFTKFADELATLPPEKYLEYLGNFTDYMRPIEHSVYNELCHEAQKKKSTDIRELLVSLRDTKLPVLQEAQMRQIKKMISLAKSLPADEEKILMDKIKQLKAEVKATKSSAPFRRKVMIERISKVKIKNKRKYDKLQKIAKNFPTSTDMNSAWIVKYSGKNKYGDDWDSYSIALRLLEFSVSNTDHIIAYDLDNNHDDISNYMAMHSACNGQKANKPFLQWLNEDKNNRIKYMREYFEGADKLISSKKLSKKKYRKYVAYATQTVFEASKGQVDIRKNPEEGEIFKF